MAHLGHIWAADAGFLIGNDILVGESTLCIFGAKAESALGGEPTRLFGSRLGFWVICSEPTRLLMSRLAFRMDIMHNLSCLDLLGIKIP